MTDLELAARPIAIRPDGPVPAGYTDADFTISAAAAERLINAPAENTLRAHDYDWGNFTAWCEQHGRVPLPATAQTLLDYVTWMMEKPKPSSPASIDRAMGSIRAIHAERGYDDQPGVRPSRRVLRAYRRQWSDAGNRVRKATPVMVDSLRAMMDTCDPDTPAGVRDRAILLLGFALMARRSELAGLDIGDVQPGQEGLDVTIKMSKTDQEAKGQEVPVLTGQHPETCPVRATQAWITLLAERGITSGPLFRPVDRHGRIGNEPEAAGKPRDRLTGRAVAEIVRRHALAAGLKDASKYKGHSLRSGGASAAYATGAPVSGIAGHGRWAENSPVVLGYVRQVDKWKNHPMRGVGL
ncbi:MAG TPA: site-specific integrase [Candidatus Sulfotelmatobacter sp.]|nr:site-specific integrase [Candidatus Sulfotelmatobacter sp.]